LSEIREMTAPKMPKSLWVETAREKVLTPALAQDADVDVVVIGAGFTGLSTSLHLAKAGISVLCLDAAEPGWGASGRNGGQVIPGLKGDPDDLETIFGSDAGGKMIELSGAAPSLVFSLIKEYDIDCDPQEAGWIQPAHCTQSLNTVLRRCDQWRTRGADVAQLDANEVSNLVGSHVGAYTGGWLDRRGGAVQPLAYARGLARAAQSEGAGVHEKSRVTAMQKKANRWHLKLENGTHVTAQRVVLATNGYTDSLWPSLRRTVFPVYSFQTASAPLPVDVRKTLFPKGHVASDTRRLLWYYRLTPEGRLVMGGRGPYREDPGVEPAQQALRNLESLFPEAGSLTPEFIWAGRVAMTVDHFPQLYALEESVFAGLGFNGRGVAMGTMMGKCLAELAKGGPSPWPVSQPQTFKMHALGRIGVMAYGALYSFLDRRETRQHANTQK